MSDPLQVLVRPAEPADAPELIALMRELAAFENYLAEFAVTEAVLLSRGFPETGTPQFFALLAEDSFGAAVGYAVYYLVDFTYDLRPTLVIKELYVRANYRGLGTGRLLLDQTLANARSRGCGKITWAMLPTNHRAKSFYRAWSGLPDEQWEYWRRPVDSKSALD